MAPNYFGSDDSLIPGTPSYGVPPGYTPSPAYPPPPGPAYAPPTVAPGLPPLALSGGPAPASPPPAGGGFLDNFAMLTGGNNSGPSFVSMAGDAGRRALAGTYGGTGDEKGAPPAAPAAPSPPGAIAPGAAVVGGASGGSGGAGMPSLSQEQMARMTPAEIEEYNWNRSRIAQQMNVRPGPSRVVKGGKLQTGETTAGQVGASAGTTADYFAARERRADYDRQLAGVDADVAQVARVTNAEMAGVETVAQLHAEDLEKRRLAAVAQVQGDIDTAAKDVQEGKYEPDRYWNNMTGFNKALSFIGMALSGIGLSASGHGNEENAVIKGINAAVERDNINQQQVLKMKREKLTGAQALYRDTLERYGSEAAAQSAAKISKLNAMRAALAAKAEGMRANASTETVRAQGADGQWYETTGINLREARVAAGLDEEIKKEKFNLEREINGTINRSYGFTQDRVVGGGGPNTAEIDKRFRRNSELERGAVPKPGSRADQPGVLMVNGQPMPTAPGVSGTSTDKAQERVAMADQGLAILAEARKRGATAGGLIPGDPAIGLQGGLLSGLAAQLTGSGVPSPSQEKVIAEALTPGPRQEAALQALEGVFRGGKEVYVRSVGAAR